MSGEPDIAVWVKLPAGADEDHDAAHTLGLAIARAAAEAVGLRGTGLARWAMLRTYHPDRPESDDEVFLRLAAELTDADVGRIAAAVASVAPGADFGWARLHAPSIDYEPSGFKL